jgi:hypothetical protein
MVWLKSRSNGSSYKLIDSVRGVTNALSTNNGNAQVTDANGLTAFNSNGFSVSTDTSYNTNTYTYIAWQWKGSNAASVTNTNGTISSQVCVNTTSGFSIATFVGNGSSGQTIGHGLGVAPKFFFFKNTNTTGSYAWATYFANAGQGLCLDQTLFPGFSFSAPTSTVVTMPSAVGSGNTYVLYSFAPISGYSDFGVTSYTGNSLADGPFVYTGFRPAWIQLRRYSSPNGNGISEWIYIDSKRNPTNTATLALIGPPDSESSVTASYTVAVDIFSNGFKLRTTDQNFNLSGKTYLYAAFAECPFQYANAR